MLHARPDYNVRIIDQDKLIPADEPVFLLRAQDTFAALALRIYINLLEDQKAVPRSVILSLNAHLARFQNWPIKKHPDVPDIVS